MWKIVVVLLEYAKQSKCKQKWSGTKSLPRKKSAKSAKKTTAINDSKKRKKISLYNLPKRFCSQMEPSKSSTNSQTDKTKGRMSAGKLWIEILRYFQFSSAFRQISPEKKSVIISLKVRLEGRNTWSIHGITNLCSM